MKKELAIICLVSISLIGIVSASWFSDISNSFSLTGKVINLKFFSKIASSGCFDNAHENLPYTASSCEDQYGIWYSQEWGNNIRGLTCEGDFCNGWYDITCPEGSIRRCPEGSNCIGGPPGVYCEKLPPQCTEDDKILNGQPANDLNVLETCTNSSGWIEDRCTNASGSIVDDYKGEYVSQQTCDAHKINCVDVVISSPNVQKCADGKVCAGGACVDVPNCVDSGVGDLKAENICTPSLNGGSAYFICSDDKKKANQTYCIDTKNCANKPSQTCPADASVCDEDQKKCVPAQVSGCYGRLDPKTPTKSCPPELGGIDFSKKTGSYEDFAYDSITNSAEDCKYKSIEQEEKIIYYQEIAGGKCQLIQGVPTCVVDPSNKKCTAYKAYSAKFNPITIPNVLESEFATKTAEALVQEAFKVNDGLKTKKKKDYPKGWCQEGNNQCEARDYVNTVARKVSITSNAMAHPEYQCSGTKHVGTIKKGFYLKLVIDTVWSWGIICVDETLIASAVATVSPVYEKIINEAIQDKNNFVCNNDPQKLCDKEIKNLKINAEMNYGGTFTTDNPLLVPLKLVLSFGGLYAEVAYSYNIVCVKKEKTPTSTYTVKVEAGGATGKTDCFDKDNIPDESKYGTIVDLTDIIYKN